jgi:hypothetical protein
MIFRRGGEALLALLLILSLSLKVPGSISLQTDTDAARNVADRVADFLKRHEFQAVEKNTSDEDLFLLSAVAGECHMLVALLSPLGWHRDVIRKLVSPGDQLLFVFDGMIYPTQPVLRTRFDDYWRRFLRYAGGSPPLRPVLGIVGSPGCALAEMRWSELASLSEK